MEDGLDDELVGGCVPHRVEKLLRKCKPVVNDATLTITKKTSADFSISDTAVAN